MPVRCPPARGLAGGGAVCQTHDNGSSTKRQKTAQVEAGLATSEGRSTEGMAPPPRTRSALVPRQHYGAEAHHGITQGLSKDTKKDTAVQ